MQLRARNRYDALGLGLQMALLFGVCGIVVASLTAFHSPVLLLVPMALVGLVWVLRSPFRSVCAYILITDVLTIRPKDPGMEGAASGLDVVLGAAMAAIALYWVVKIKLWDNEELSVSRAHLMMVLFFIWLIPVTVGGVLVLGTSVNPALREILNLLPLLILPVLYGRYIRPDSSEEFVILVLVLVSGILVITWNIYSFRSNLVKAYYLYQTGRAVYDLALTCIIIFATTSALMLRRRWWESALLGALLLYAIAGLAISMTRALYLGVALGTILMFVLANRRERRSGRKRLLRTFGLAVIAAIPVVLTSRIFALLLARTTNRFVSSRQVARDPSILNRLLEWKAEIVRIIESPVFGSGFGSMFKFFNMIDMHHEWTGFSHNSYLYIMFKTGLVGGILFFSACAGLVVKCFTVARRSGISDRSRMILRVCIASILTQLFYAFSGPMFDSKASLMWFGVTWGAVTALDLATAKQTDSVRSREEIENSSAKYVSTFNG